MHFWWMLAPVCAAWRKRLIPLTVVLLFGLACGKDHSAVSTPSDDFDAHQSDEIWSVFEVGKAVPMLLRGRREAGTGRFDQVIVSLADYLCGRGDSEHQSIEQMFPLNELDDASAAACGGFFVAGTWVPGDPQSGVSQLPTSSGDLGALTKWGRLALHHLLRAYYADPELAAEVLQVTSVVCGRPLDGVSVESLFVVDRTGNVESLRCGGT
jgi:hypothetical protein